MSSSMTGSKGPYNGRELEGGYTQGQMPLYTPEQMQLFQQLFSHVGPESYTSRLAKGDPSLFEEMEAPAYKQFGELQGQNASRFSGMGLGSRRGSGFNNLQSQATADFAQQLQSRRQDLQRQAISDLMGLSGNLLEKKPYQNFMIEPEESGWDSFFGGALPLAGAGLGALFGGPAGAAIGGQLGSAAGAGFTGRGAGSMNFSGIGDLPSKWSKLGAS